MEIRRSQQSLNITQAETDQRTEVSKKKPVVPNQIPDSFEDASLRKDTTSQTASFSEAVKVDSKSQDLLLKQMTSARLLEPGIKRTQEKPLAAKRELATNEQKAKLEAAMQNGTSAKTQERISQPMSSGGGGRPEESSESRKGESKSKSYLLFDEPFYGGGNSNPTVIDGSKDDVPEKVRDLGMYEGGKDIISGDFNWMRFRRFEENSGESGAGYENAQLNVASMKGRIFYEASAENGSIKAGLGGEIHAQVIAAYYETGTETKVNLAGKDVNLKTEVEANVEVGAKGFLLAEASVGKDTHIHLGFAQFVGANAEVEVKETVGDYGSVRGGFGQSVGFGISGSVYAGVNDGEVKVDVDDLGFAVFYGGTVDAGFSVDTSKLSELGNETAEGGFDLARNFWESRSKAAGEFANDAAETSKGVVEDMREAIENYAEEASATAEDAAQDAYETAEDAVETAVDTATDAAEDTAEDIEDAWNDFWD